MNFTFKKNLKKKIYFFLSFFLPNYVMAPPLDMEVIEQNLFEKKYKIIFHDEFKYIGAPDPALWDYEIGFIRNEEPQWYQKQNAFVDGEYLRLKAKQERVSNPHFDPSSTNWTINRPFAEYTSASLMTANRFHFKYGKVEIRSKIDIRQGQWPAFWAIGARNVNKENPVDFPILGEIDILEYYKGHLYANLFWEGNDGLNQNVQKNAIKNIGGKDNAQEFFDDFHIWTLIWTENDILVLLDNKYILNRVSIREIQNYHEGSNPFHHEFYLILNLALGHAGEKILYPNKNEDTEFIIDYVRVYEEEEK